MIHDVGRQDTNKTIKTHFALRYAHRVIARLNKDKENDKGQKRKTSTVKIKVSGLSPKWAKQNDPKLV